MLASGITVPFEEILFDRVNRLEVNRDNPPGFHVHDPSLEDIEKFQREISQGVQNTDIIVRKRSDSLLDRDNVDESMEAMIPEIDEKVYFKEEVRFLISSNVEEYLLAEGIIGEELHSWADWVKAFVDVDNICKLPIGLEIKSISDHIVTFLVSCSGTIPMSDIFSLQFFCSGYKIEEIETEDESDSDIDMDENNYANEEFTHSADSNIALEKEDDMIIDDCAEPSTQNAGGACKRELFIGGAGDCWLKIPNSECWDLDFTMNMFLSDVVNQLELMVEPFELGMFDQFWIQFKMMGCGDIHVEDVCGYDPENPEYLPFLDALDCLRDYMYDEVEEHDRCYMETVDEWTLPKQKEDVIEDEFVYLNVKEEDISRISVEMLRSDIKVWGSGNCWKKLPGMRLVDTKVNKHKRKGDKDANRHATLDLVEESLLNHTTRFSHGLKQLAETRVKWVVQPDGDYHIVDVKRPIVGIDSDMCEDWNTVLDFYNEIITVEDRFLVKRKHVRGNGDCWKAIPFIKKMVDEETVGKWFEITDLLKVYNKLPDKHQTNTIEYHRDPYGEMSKMRMDDHYFVWCIDDDKDVHLIKTIPMNRYPHGTPFGEAKKETNFQFLGKLLVDQQTVKQYFNTTAQCEMYHGDFYTCADWELEHQWYIGGHEDFFEFLAWYNLNDFEPELVPDHNGPEFVKWVSGEYDILHPQCPIHKVEKEIFSKTYDEMIGPELVASRNKMMKDKRHKIISRALKDFPFEDYNGSYEMEDRFRKVDTHGRSYLSYDCWKYYCRCGSSGKQLFKLSPDIDKTKTHLLPRKQGKKRKILVGSTQHFNAALDMHAPDVLKTEVVKYCEQWSKTRPITKYALSKAQMDEAQIYFGFDFTSSNSQLTSSDHPTMQVARNFCRRDELHMLHPEEDKSPVLHIGATMADFKAWRSRPSHDFQFYMKDTKDASRTICEFTHYVRNMMVERKYLKPGENGIITWPDFGSLVDWYNEFIEKRKRIYVGDCQELGTHYQKLIFSDSLYDISNDEFMEYMLHTGALEASAVMFIPFGFYDELYMKTDFYKVEDYLDIPGVTEFCDWWMEYYPGWLICSPFLAKAWEESFEQPIPETMYDITVKFREKGMDLIKSFIHGLSGTHAFSAFCGRIAALLKWYAVFDFFFKKFIEAVYERWGRTNVTWKGYSNGYDHKTSTWKGWANKRLISYGHSEKYGNQRYHVSFEQVSRYGEMGLYKFFRTQTPTVTWRFSVPDHLKCMKIVDWHKSLVPRGSGVFAWRPNITYTSCRVRDFYMLYSWALAEPQESITLEVMLTAANRIRKGLALISYTPFQGLDVSDKEVLNFATNVWLYWCKSKNILKTLENEKDYIVGESTWLWVKAMQACTIVSNFVTGGLAWTAVSLLKLIFDTENNVEFIEEPPDPELHIERARFLHSEVITNHRVTMYNPDNFETPEKISSCMLCQMAETGKFGEQLLHKENEDCHNGIVHEWEILPQEVQTLKTIIQTAKNEHRPHMSEAMIDSLERFERKFSFEDVAPRLHGKARFHYILGGAGTGKSTVMRELANYYETEGKVVGIGVPLRALKDDFKNCRLLDGTVKSFNCQTPWVMPKWTSLDVLMIDEAGLHSEDWFRAYIAYTNPTDIYIIGDHNQQFRTPIFDQRPGVLNGNWWSTIKKTKHELVVNFRLDRWRVQMLNQMNGTHMIAKNKQRIVPDLITREHYNQIRDELLASSQDKGGLREMVYAHASAVPIFGKQSNPGRGEDDENLSVYSSQGKTCWIAAVSVSDFDLQSMLNHGAAYVSVSRSLNKTYFVAHDVNSPVAAQCARVFGLNDQDRVWDIPDFVHTPYKVMDVPDNINKAKVKIPTVEHINLDGQLEGKIKTQEMMPKKDFTQNANLNGIVLQTELSDEMLPAVLRGYDNVIQNCTVECLGKYKLLYLREFIYPKLMKLESEGLASRENFIWKSDTVHFVKLAEFVTWLESNRINYIIFSEYEKTYWKNSRLKMVIAKRNNMDEDPLYLKIADGHIEEGKKPIWSVQVKNYAVAGANAVAATNSLPLDHLHEGRYLAELLPQKKVLTEKQLFCYDFNDFNLMEDVQLGYAKVHKIASNLPPTFKIVNIDRVDHRFRASLADYQGKTYVDNLEDRDAWFEKPASISNCKNRFNEFDAYRHPQVFDDSEAYQIVTSWPAPTDLYSLKAPNSRYPTAKVQTDRLIMDRTKTGKLRKKNVYQKWGIVPGYGNYFSNSPWDTFKALGRVLKPKRKKLLTNEAREYMEEAAKRAINENHAKFVIDSSLEKKIIYNALADCRRRNYYGRALADNNNFVPFYRTFATNKGTYKPRKNDEINHSKLGQALISGGPNFNARFVPGWRVLGRHYKESAKPHLLIDTYEKKTSFVKRLMHKVQNMPISAQVVVMDSKEYDSGQGPVTVYMQQMFQKHLGHNQEFLAPYFELRKPVQLVAHGLLKGKTSGEKPSGLPDTKTGNDMLTEVMSTDILRGIGPQVRGIKGDDQIAWKCNLEIHEKAVKSWRTYTNIDSWWEVGSKEFIGLITTSKGVAPALERIASKVAAKRFDSKKLLQEYQVALRDEIQEIKAYGFQNVIDLNSQATGKSKDFYNFCLAFVMSFSHITWDQFVERAKLITRTKFVKAAGWNQIHLSQY